MLQPGTLIRYEVIVVKENVILLGTETDYAWSALIISRGG